MRGVAWRGRPRPSRRAAAGVSSSARGEAAATSRSSACDGASKLPGTCMANQPPGARRLDPAGQQVEVPGHPLQRGVGDEDVEAVRAGCHVATSACTHSTRPAGSCSARAGQHLRRGVDADAPGRRGQRSARPRVSGPGRSRGRRRAPGSSAPDPRRAGRRTAGRAGRRTRRTAWGPRHGGSHAPRTSYLDVKILDAG